MRSQFFEYSDFGEKLQAAGVGLNFVNAPYRCTPEDVAKIYPQVKEVFGHLGGFYEWCNASDDASELRRLDETIAFLEREMAEQGPYDGLIGFSQCGMLAHLV